MIRRTPTSTRTETPCPYTTLFRAAASRRRSEDHPHEQLEGAGRTRTPFPGGAHLPGGGRRASSSADDGARPQHGRAGRAESDMEARGGAKGPGGAVVTRQL